MFLTCSFVSDDVIGVISCIICSIWVHETTETLTEKNMSLFMLKQVLTKSFFVVTPEEGLAGTSCNIVSGPSGATHQPKVSRELSL